MLKVPGMPLARPIISPRLTVWRALATTLLITAAAVAADPASDTPTDLNALVRASIRADRNTIQAGKPVWVEFVLTNLTENRITLRVPEVSTDPVEVAEMGLPAEHVFSGRGFTGPRLEDEHGERRESRDASRPKGQVPAIKLSPRGSAGIRLDLSQYYPSLQRPGEYKLTWQPYNGSISSDTLSLKVLAERQAIILTDLGKMTMRFYYEEAPEHVQNFIELVEQRFYDNLTFNRIIPGGLIQGGDQLGNRRGVRPDGKRIKAEFNKIPFEMGTVGMARSSHDPDSASSQFFISLGRQPGFDGQQTAFGYLVGEDSMQTLKRIAAVPTAVHNGLADYPKKPVYIRAISLESVPTRERRVEPAPITPPTTQPTLGGPTDGLSSATAASDHAHRTPDLPGLRAQGNLARRPATQPER